MNVMSQTVQKNAGEHFGAEDVGPFVKWQVDDDESGPSFISLAEDLEEQFCPGLGEQHEAEFVDDQQL